jgi:hypothetical protein
LGVVAKSPQLIETVQVDIGPRRRLKPWLAWDLHNIFSSVAAKRDASAKSEKIAPAEQ